MTHPTVNLNGTSRELLMERAVRILSIISELETAMKYASPHGRDYPVLGDIAKTTHGTLDQAWIAHMALNEKIEDVRRFWEKRTEILDQD